MGNAVESSIPEPKSKPKIIARLQTERKRLEQNLAGLSQEDMLQPGVVNDWSVKDVLAHLADWEAHMPAWIEAARRGDPVAEIEPGLNWKQFEAFNQRIYARHRDQTLEEVLAFFHETHRQFMQMVEAMPEDEMLTHGRFGFIGKGVIYDWLKAYANHDVWGKNHIRKWMKQRSSI
jgi:hypothetical protein